MVCHPDPATSHATPCGSGITATTAQKMGTPKPPSTPVDLLAQLLSEVVGHPRSGTFRIQVPAGFGGTSNI